MVKYFVFSLISVVFAFTVEKTADFIFSGDKFSVRSKISKKRFFLILVTNIAVGILCLHLYKSEPIAALLFLLGFDILLLITAEDIKQKKISNIFLIILFIVSVAFTLIDTSIPWYMHIFGCGMGYLPFFLIRILLETVKKQEVLGSGDIYLNGIIGLLLGLQKYLLCGLIASSAALIAVRVIRHKKQYDKMHTYPFSPFFLLGYTVCILSGDWIITKLVDLIV